MDKKKLVTWEMFKKYHELLVGSTEDDDLETAANDKYNENVEDDEVENV